MTSFECADSATRAVVRWQVARKESNADVAANAECRRESVHRINVSTVATFNPVTALRSSAVKVCFFLFCWQVFLPSPQPYPGTGFSPSCTAAAESTSGLRLRAGFLLVACFFAMNLLAAKNERSHKKELPTLISRQVLLHVKFRRTTVDQEPHFDPCCPTSSFLCLFVFFVANKLCDTKWPVNFSAALRVSAVSAFQNSHSLAKVRLLSALIGMSSCTFSLFVFARKM